MPNNNIIIFDFETIAYGNDKATNSEVCDIVQLAALPIERRTLKISTNKAFSTMIKPSKGASKVNKDSIEFHAKVRGKTPEEIITMWESSPTIETVWPSFIKYLESYRVGKNEWGLPISAGHNIIRFDLPIANRLNKQYGNGKDIFHPRDFIDTMNLCFLWLESDNRVSSYSLDNLRDFMGMDKKGGHDALKDCIDCSKIIQRFLRYHRSRNLNLAGSFKDWDDNG